MIKTESDYDEALDIIAALMEMTSLSEDDSDRLDILVTPVNAYEDIHHQIPAPDPISIWNFS